MHQKVAKVDNKKNINATIIINKPTTNLKTSKQIKNIFFNYNIPLFKQTSLLYKLTRVEIFYSSSYFFNLSIKEYAPVLFFLNSSSSITSGVK